MLIERHEHISILRNTWEKRLHVRDTSRRPLRQVKTNMSSSKIRVGQKEQEVFPTFPYTEKKITVGRHQNTYAKYA